MDPMAYPVAKAMADGQRDLSDYRERLQLVKEHAQMKERLRMIEADLRRGADQNIDFRIDLCLKFWFGIDLNEEHDC